MKLKNIFDSIIEFFKGMFHFKKSKQKLVIKRTLTKNFDYTGKVFEWRERERKCPSLKDLPNLPKIEMLNWAVTTMKQNINYLSDPENWGQIDYWPTSQEVFERKKEDCDGQAIAIWRILHDSGKFNDLDIGLILVHGHMCACYHLDNDFYVLDNGYLTPTIELASKVFPVKKDKLDIYPLCGFNLTNGWVYK